MPGEKTTTTVPTTTGYWPGRSYAGSGWNPAWGGRSFAGYPGAWNGAGAWNGLRRSQLGYGYPGWNGANGWNGAGWNGAWNPAINNAV